MVNTYHKTGRKEYVDGRLRVVYQKDKSSKQYIKRGDRYVALRTSAIKKGGNGPMEVTKDNIEAAIIVYAKEGEAQKFYTFNNNNMAKLKDSERLFKRFIAPDGSRGSSDEVKFDNYPMDAIGYTFKTTGLLIKKTNVLEQNNDYNIKKKKGFNDLDALIYCLDVSPDAAAATATATATAKTEAGTAKTEAETAKTDADTVYSSAKATISASKNIKDAVGDVVTAVSDVVTAVSDVVIAVNAIDAAAATAAAAKAEAAATAATTAATAAKLAMPVAATVGSTVNSIVANAEAAAAKANTAAKAAAKAVRDFAAAVAPSTVSKKYMVITFIISNNLCTELFDTDGSNPKSGQEDFLKSGNSTPSTEDAGTEKPKTTIKDALEYINNNGTVTGTKLYEYGKNFYNNIIINNSP
jgi:hypothetical protein